jgi:hypothetical protein
MSVLILRKVVKREVKSGISALEMGIIRDLLFKDVDVGSIRWSVSWADIKRCSVGEETKHLDDSLRRREKIGLIQQACSA